MHILNMIGKKADIKVEKGFNISDLIERLRAGEEIKCLKCKKGIYVTKKEFISTSHSFWCDKCGDLLHVANAEFTVE